jgi:predicted esterase
MEATEKHIEVRRTARFYQIGEAGPDISRIWYVVHGYGQLASFFVRHFEQVSDANTLVVAPEALSRFYSDGLAGRVGASWMTKEDRLTEIDDYVGYLDELHLQISKDLRPDVEIVLLGFSQGTSTAWRWMKKGNVKVDHLVNWAGSVPSEMNEEWIKKLETIRFYSVLGDKDPYISTKNADIHIETLRKIKPDLHDLRFHGEHRMDAPTLSKLNDLIGK